jgi:thymidylate kinase
MLFKSTGLFPSFHYLSSNLDVIVPDGRAVVARRHLIDLGYVELLNVEEPRKFLFRRFPGDGTTFAFHLHEVVGWGVPFLDNDPLWEGARSAGDDPDILIPAPREALLITLAHWFYEDKELQLGNLFLTANALGQYEGSLGDAAVLAADRGWEEGFWAAIRIADRAWENLYGAPLLAEERRAEVHERLRAFSHVRRDVLSRVHYGSRTPATVPFVRNKVVYYRKIARDPARSVWQRICDIRATLLWALRWKLHIRSQRPLLVSLSGCDGSGKTVHARRLQKTLETCDLRNRVIWSRGASSRFIAPFLHIGKKLTGAGGSADQGENVNESARFSQRRRGLRHPLARAVFAWLFAIDLAWTYCVRTRFALWLGNVVISDRYVYDALVDYSLYTGTGLDEIPTVLRWLERVSPHPHVRLLLDVEPGEALRRKPEEGATGHLESAREAFLRLARSRDIAVLPGDQSAEDVQRRVSGLTLGAFYERYGTLCNGLLFSNPSQLNPRSGVQ